MVERGSLWITEDTPLTPITQKFQGFFFFKSSVPGTGDEDQIYISFFFFFLKIRKR